MITSTLPDEVIERIAQNLYSSVLFTCPASCKPPPVPLDKILKYLGLRYKSAKYHQLEKDSIGALLVEEKTVVVDDTYPMNIQRFTTAHEIGHWLLHVAPQQSPNMGLGKHLTDWLQSASTKSQKKRARQEKEADKFAAALLVPQPLLQRVARQYRNRDVDAFRAIARTFKVSQETLLYRLQDLDERGRLGLSFDWESLSLLEREWNNNKSDDARENIYNFIKEMPSLKGGLIAVKPAPLLPEDTIRRRPMFARRKLIIEVDGLPNAGKDTQINLLAKYLRRSGHTVTVVEEGFKVCTTAGSSAFLPHQLKLQYSISHATTKLIEYGSRSDIEVILVNRGVFDLLALTQFWYWRHRISEVEFAAQKKWLLEILQPWVDLIFFIHVTPEESMRREHSEGRAVLEHLAYNIEGKEFPRQEIVDPDSLKQLDEAYNHVLSSHQEAFQTLYEIPSKTIAQTAEEITRVVLPQLPQKKRSSKKEEVNQLYLPGFEPLEMPVVPAKDAHVALTQVNEKTEVVAVDERQVKSA